MEIGQLATGCSSIGRPVGGIAEYNPFYVFPLARSLRRDERISDGGIDKVIRRRRSGKDSAAKTETP